jgi:hypothetical protein
MVVTRFGIVTEVRLAHPSKAHLPMMVTLVGIVTEVRLLHPERCTRKKQPCQWR